MNLEDIMIGLANLGSILLKEPSEENVLLAKECFKHLEFMIEFIAENTHPSGEKWESTLKRAEEIIKNN